MSRSPLALCLFTVCLLGCEDAGKVSSVHAGKHVDMLVEASRADVEEIRKGLPEGAKHLTKLYEAPRPPAEDREAVRAALRTARNNVQDLRVAKATFFALVDSDGKVLRNDQDQDLMADRDAFAAFPALRAALEGKYVEARGMMKEARGVAEPTPDAQWVAGAPVQVAGVSKGVYVAGWAFSSYAYRLEFKLRAAVKTELQSENDARKNEPLVYVFVLADEGVYGAPVSPSINREALAKMGLLSKIQGDAAYTDVVEITGRVFGVAARRAPWLGPDNAVRGVCSET